MADAKKIKIGGTWYNVKDETARNGLAGKVSKSGDTMTGNLVTTGSTYAIRRDGDKLIRFNNASDQEQGAMYLSNSNHQIAFRSYDDDYTNTEVYKLPAPDSLTANKSYDILTSKKIDSTPTANSTNPVTSGGVKTAVDAKVSKSGDTMTGNLTVTNTQPIVRLVPSDTSKMKLAQITISGNNRFMFWQDTPDGNGHALYRLPETDTSATGNNYYDILTSKTPVTVAQGGTGGTDSGVKSLSNSSVYSGMIRYRKIGVFVYLYLDGVQVKTDISASTIRDLATLPEGYRPTHPSGASLFGFAGNAGNPGIISITTSGVISFTPMSAWSVNAILRGSIMYCI